MMWKTLYTLAASLERIPTREYQAVNLSCTLLLRSQSTRVFDVLLRYVPLSFKQIGPGGFWWFLEKRLLDFLGEFLAVSSCASLRRMYLWRRFLPYVNPFCFARSRIFCLWRSLLRFVYFGLWTMPQCDEKKESVARVSHVRFPILWRCTPSNGDPPLGK